MVATNEKPTERYRQSAYTDFAHAGPGTLAGDCLRCFYQGWRHDASGQYVEMPAESATIEREAPRWPGRR